jgi:hypothetical protein
MPTLSGSCSTRSAARPRTLLTRRYWRRATSMVERGNGGPTNTAARPVGRCQRGVARGRGSPYRKLMPDAKSLDGGVLAGRATCVPHQTDNPGIERTTTVTSIRLLSWSSSPDQLERIPRMCLIRRRPPGQSCAVTRSLWSMGRRPGSVDGRGSRPVAGGRPRAGAVAQAASGSRSWRRRRGGRARPWRRPRGGWPGRRRAARRTALAALRLAVPGQGRATSHRPSVSNTSSRPNPQSCVPR